MYCAETVITESARRVYRFTLTVISRTVLRTLPPERWYPAVFQISRLLTRCLRLCRHWARDCSLSQAVFVNGLPALLTRTGQPFPVPWTAEGLDLIWDAFRLRPGLVLCSGHLSLVEVAGRVLMDAGPDGSDAGDAHRSDGAHPGTFRAAGGQANSVAGADELASPRNGTYSALPAAASPGRLIVRGHTWETLTRRTMIDRRKSWSTESADDIFRASLSLLA